MIILHFDLEENKILEFGKELAQLVNPHELFSDEENYKTGLEVINLLKRIGEEPLKDYDETTDLFYEEKYYKNYFKGEENYE